VLSSPHLITTDNEEAEISVGQNIPYIGGVTIGGFGGGAAGGIPGLGQASVQRQDVALTMKITPHVNASDMVRLEIEQEIQEVGEPDPQLGPTWLKRKIKTTVVARDQQTIVIGGLMSDRIQYSEEKIPLLGDIPLLGYLFKYTSKTKKKNNLLVLLTPYVIQDQVDIEQIVERKVRERAEFLRSFSALDQMPYLPAMDYRRKRGLLEEINRTVEEIEFEADQLRDFNAADTRPEGAIEYGSEPATEEPTPGDEGDATPGHRARRHPRHRARRDPGAGHQARQGHQGRKVRPCIPTVDSWSRPLLGELLVRDGVITPESSRSRSASSRKRAASSARSWSA
jgi:general secretion pathway protein D